MVATGTRPIKLRSLEPHCTREHVVGCRSPETFTEALQWATARSVTLPRRMSAYYLLLVSAGTNFVRVCTTMLPAI